MFGIWELRRIRLDRYWHVLVPAFETSTDAFYEAVRASLEEKRVPDLEISEISFREGGAMSARRRYLRLRRERLVFDVCSAPFGTSWFFCCRFGEIPSRLRVWEVLAMLAALYLLLALHATLFGWVAGSALLVANVAAFLFLANGLLATELTGLDAVLLRLPVVGAFYERFLRPGTYYRDDTRRMYAETVDGVVRAAVLAVAGEAVPGGIAFAEEEVPTGVGFLGGLLLALGLARRPGVGF